MTAPDDITPIALADLTTTWRTLTQIIGNYKPGSAGSMTIIEARRFVEVELRSQHGDQAWTEVTGHG